MKRQRLSLILAHPVTVAIGITLLFASRFFTCLPFSGFTREFNYETAATLISYLIFAQEPWSFPLGTIKGLTFPFEVGNVGNVGAIPLFALCFKALGTIFTYFKTFDYFVLLDILSCFFTAFFSQKILGTLGVHRTAIRVLGALLTGASFLIFTRSAMLQPFCVVAFPLYAAWIYATLLTLQRGKWKLRHDLIIVSLFPIATLLDNYTFFALLLGTAALFLREIYEALWGSLHSSWNRTHRILFIGVGGILLSVLALYAIGMYPLPPIPATFTSYDFGMGGRYHVADLFGPWIPIAGTPLPESSLLARLGLPLTTNNLGPGQYEGVAYVGTPILFLWIFIGLVWIISLPKQMLKRSSCVGVVRARLVLYSPWKKVGLASLVVFLFSLGYELHALGHGYPGYSGMPAAWIADSFPALYNLRATGRLASLLSFFLIIEGIRRFSVWSENISWQEGTKRLFFLTYCLIGLLFLVHLVEISPFLCPIPALPSHPIGNIYSEEEIAQLKQIGTNHDIVMIGPSVRAVGVRWTTEAFSLAYYLALRSNLSYIARTLPEHNLKIAKDLARILNGHWSSLEIEYGRNILFAIPINHAETLRPSVSANYDETIVGPVSLWSRRHPKPN